MPRGRSLARHRARPAAGPQIEAIAELLAKAGAPAPDAARAVLALLGAEAGIWTPAWHLDLDLGPLPPAPSVPPALHAEGPPPADPAMGSRRLVIVAERRDVGRLLGQLARARAVPLAAVIAAPAPAWRAMLAGLGRGAAPPIVLLAAETRLSPGAVANQLAATPCRVVVLLAGAARGLRWPRSLPYRPSVADLPAASWLEACGWPVFQTPQEAVGAARLLAAGVEPRGACPRLLTAGGKLAGLLAETLSAAGVPTAGEERAARAFGSPRPRRGAATADRPGVGAEGAAPLRLAAGPGLAAPGRRTPVLRIDPPSDALEQGAPGTLHVDLADLRALGELLRVAGLTAPREDPPLAPPARRRSGRALPSPAPARAAQEAAARVRELRWSQGPRLGDLATKALLGGFGLAAPAERVVRSASAAAQAALAGDGGPATVRVLASGPTAPLGWGGERGNVVSAPDARQAFREVVAACGRHWPQATITGVLVSRVPPLLAATLAGGLIRLGAESMLYLRWIDQPRPRSCWVLARLPAPRSVLGTLVERLLADARASDLAGARPARLRAALRSLLDPLGLAAAALGSTVAWVGLHRIGFPIDGAPPLLIETEALLQR